MELESFLMLTLQDVVGDPFQIYAAKHRLEGSRKMDVKADNQNDYIILTVQDREDM